MADKDLSFDLGFSPEQFSTLPAEDGAGWKRHPFGDFTLKVIDGEIIPTKNAKVPHNMLKVTFESTKAYDERNKGAVGQTVTGLYGTGNSPAFMQKRFKALCDACKVQPVKGKLTFAMLAGKTFDATVVWEMSDSGKLDDFGQKKFWVNDRVKAERVVGTARPKTIDPVADSAKAVKYLDNQEASDGGDDDNADEPAPWAGGANGAASGAAASGGATSTGAVATTPSFVPESEVDPQAHAYRALYKIGGEDGEEAKQTLIENGFDPEGPIDLANVPDEIKAKYEAKFPPKAAAKKAGGLPALSGKKK